MHELIAPRDDIEKESRRNLKLAIREIRRELGIRVLRDSASAAWNDYMQCQLMLEQMHPGVLHRSTEPRTIREWVEALRR